MQTNSGTETILIVDHEVAIRSIAHMMLTRFGYSVVVADSAKSALELLEWPGLEVDLALVDVSLASADDVGLSGIHAARPNLPILFLASSVRSEEWEILRAKRLPYILKPFTSLALTKSVRSVLDKSEGAASQAL